MRWRGKFNRNLYDESDISKSTSWSSWTIANKNWHIRRNCYNFSGWNWNYSITTRDGYDVINVTQGHGNCWMWISQSDFSSLMWHKYVRAVIDYISIGTQPSSYCSQWWFSCWSWNDFTQYCASDWRQWICSALGLAFSNNYKAEMIIRTEDSAAVQIWENLSSKVETYSEFTKTRHIEPAGTYRIWDGWYDFWVVIRDYYWSDVMQGNLHIYYAD